MNKIWIILAVLLLSCIIGCDEKEEQIFEIGDIVCVKDDQEWRGPIHRITRCDNNSTHYVIYHIKVYCGQMKGHVVIRRKTVDLNQLIPDPR